MSEIEYPSNIMKRIAIEISERFGVKKVYFAKAIGNRLHYIAGHGDETYLPPVKLHIIDNLYVFIEDLLPPSDNMIEGIVDFIYKRIGDGFEEYG